MNNELIKILTSEKLTDLGFAETWDESDNSVESWWQIENENYLLMIDRSFEVQLMRINPATNFLKLKIESLDELEHTLDWILD